MLSLRQCRLYGGEFRVINFRNGRGSAFGMPILDTLYIARFPISTCNPEWQVTNA
jgi:hypothetical protein